MENVIDCGKKNNKEYLNIFVFLVIVLFVMNSDIH